MAISKREFVFYYYQFFTFLHRNTLFIPVYRECEIKNIYNIQSIYLIFIVKFKQ